VRKPEAADDDASMRRVTIATATGDLVSGAAEERADLIRNFTVGLKDLETVRDVSFADAAIGFGLDQNEAQS
jgi:hypothetical protein